MDNNSSSTPQQQQLHQQQQVINDINKVRNKINDYDLKIAYIEGTVSNNSKLVEAFKKFKEGDYVNADAGATTSVFFPLYRNKLENYRTELKQGMYRVII